MPGDRGASMSMRRSPSRGRLSSTKKKRTREENIAFLEKHQPDIRPSFWGPKIETPGARTVPSTIGDALKFSIGGANLDRSLPCPTMPQNPPPGAYELEPGLGKQLMSTRASSPTPKIGTSDRFWEKRKLYKGPKTDEGLPDGVPGPGTYELPSTLAVSPVSRKKQREPDYPDPYDTDAPGPGSYPIAEMTRMGQFHSSVQKSSPAAGFGAGSRTDASKLYTGKGRHVMNMDPTPGFKHNIAKSSLGPQLVGRSAPKFSFGGKLTERKGPKVYDETGVPRPPAEVATARPPSSSGTKKIDEAQAARLKTAKDRKRGNKIMRRRRGKGKGGEATMTRRQLSDEERKQRELAKSKDYSWLYPEKMAAMQRSKKAWAYEARKDGCDMPPAKSKSAPHFSFGGGDRFKTNIYAPQNPQVIMSSPGPAGYHVRTDMTRVRSTLWSRTASARCAPTVEELAKRENPGPGTYDVLPEHRVEREAMTEELMKQLKQQQDGEEDTLSEEEADPETGELRRKKKKKPLALSASAPNLAVTGRVDRERAVNYSSGAGKFKFGGIQHERSAPVVGFPKGSRDAAKKLYGPGPFNSGAAGASSPGPVYLAEKLKSHSPSFGFGDKVSRGEPIRKEPVARHSDLIPVPSNFGRQPSSRMRSGGTAAFGTGTRDAMNKTHFPGGNEKFKLTHSPGPVYITDDGFGPSPIGRPLTKTFSFSATSRVLDPVSKEAKEIPGPGSYHATPHFKPTPIKK